MMQQGTKVIIYATVLRARIDPNTDPAYHTVDLQLPDGQLLQTNVANLSHSGLKAMLEPPENKAIEAAPESKSRGKK
jgi:hypothetical protein